MTVSSLNATTLIIVSQDPAEHLGALMSTTPMEDASVILVQEAVTATNIPGKSVHVLEEDLQDRHATSPFPHVTYEGMLQMIFAAKNVMVL